MSGTLENSRRRALSRAPVLIAALMVAAYAVLFAYLGILRYESTFSQDWRDEAVNNQMMFNTARGDPLFSTVKGEQRNHRHFRPIFLPASLPYVIVRDARAWYILVALMSALGGVAAYRLGSRLLGGPRFGAFACATWLLWPALHEITLGNLDPETFSAALWLFAAAAYVETRFASFAVFAVLAVCSKETQAPVLAAFGLIALLQRRGARWWAAPMAVGAAWFVVALKVVIPSYTPAFDTIYERFIGAEGASFPVSFFIALAGDPRGTMAAIFSADHLSLFARMMLPLLFLPVLAPLPLLACASIATQIFLLKDPLPVRQAHMISALLPFIFWAALAGLRRLSGLLARLPGVGGRVGQVRTILASGLVASCVVFIFQDGLFGRFQNYGREPLETIRASRALDPAFFRPTAAEYRAAKAIASIGPDIDAAANSRLLLLMSNRPRLIEFGTQRTPMELGGTRVIVLWFLEAQCRTCTFTQLSPENLRMAAELVRAGDFQVAAYDPAFAILISKARPPAGLAPVAALEPLFLARVYELAGRLDRAEGLPFDEPR